MIYSAVLSVPFAHESECGSIWKLASHMVGRINMGVKGGRAGREAE